MIIAECSRCRYRGRLPADVRAEAMLRCDRCGARGRFLLVGAEARRLDWLAKGNGRGVPGQSGRSQR